MHHCAAAIVRTMKARKTLTHSLLVSELYQQVQAHAHTGACHVYSFNLSAFALRARVLTSSL